MKILTLALSTVFALTLTGCSMKHHHGAHNQSIVKLASKSGSKTKGTLYLEDHYGGVIITGKISGLKPGPHGFHVHEMGDCKAADASSAGAHFHIAATEVHGEKDASGSHTGDLGNIEADKNGVADIKVFAKGVTLGKGENTIANRSLVIHADVDDFKTQPAGNSGKRIACGVIEVKACDHCGGCTKSGCDHDCKVGCKHKKCHGDCKAAKHKDCGCEKNKDDKKS
jgi:Cu-Zn family superoxide dismutase